MTRPASAARMVRDHLVGTAAIREWETQLDWLARQLDAVPDVDPFLSQEAASAALHARGLQADLRAIDRRIAWWVRAALESRDPAAT